MAALSGGSWREGGYCYDIRTTGHFKESDLVFLFIELCILHISFPHISVHVQVFLLSFGVAGHMRASSFSFSHN